MATDPNVIPLPEELKLCGCPGAERGLHLTSCVAARALDAIPLSEREGYVEDAAGRSNSFQGIRWDYPLRLTVDLNIQVEMDPVAWFTQHLKGYLNFDLDREYEAWEKPIQFIVREIEDSYAGIGGGRYIARDWASFDDEVHVRWTEEDTHRLHVALGIETEVDPNQLAMPLTDPEETP